MEAVADGSGSFMFNDVSHGTGLKLYAAPPANLSGEEGAATGYLPTLVMGLIVSGHVVVRDMELPYYVLPPPPLVNITDFGPKGMDVLIDAPFNIEFSVPMNVTSVENAFSESPQVLDTSFAWDENWTSVVVSHSRFAYNTTYTVVLNGSIVSMEGVGLLNGTVLSWTFKTVRETPPPPPIDRWEIFSAEVSVDPTDKDVTVEVLGRANMTIYVVIQNVGSYKLLGTIQGQIGTYTVTVQGTALAWNTNYS